MLKVRIDKAEKETFWYSNKIGQEFNVENWIGCKEWYRCTFDAKGILKSDCTVLQSDTQPEQWVPKVGEFVIAFANPIRREFWGHTGKCIISEECDYVFEFNKEKQVDSMLSGVHKALPNEIPQPEPKGYCIKRTPENAEVLNKWLNIDRVREFYFNNTGLWVCSVIPKGMENYSKPLIVNNVPDGFCILNTVEEFFAKVGYTPETNVSNSTPLSEPKLIAKEGEFIKLVSTKGEHALKVNMPVKLISNYKEGGYIQLNGYSYTAEFIEKNSMKFELCPAPVSEPVQVDTPIERDTEDFKIGQIIEVHEEPYYRKMKVESGWMYNFYDTKNDNYSRGWIFVPEHSLKN